MNDASPLTAAQKALLALREVKARLAAVEQAAHEPIAVVGMAFRLPGGIRDEAALWELLRRGGDAIVPVPRERWDADAFYDPDPERPGTIYSRHGGFLSEDVGAFDAAFFGISPREARAMDPQQRLLLEVSFEALEDAGLVKGALENSRTGVFVGCMGNDYGRRFDQPGTIDLYTGTGNSASFLAGRVAYALGVQGPCMALDTACSSSLVATHLACQSLRAGECETALAAGVNLMLSAEMSLALCRLKALSPAGRCRPFDAAADGYVRGEGCAVLVLKRRSDAVAHGDRILALIRGSAVTHDGPSGGLTVPNRFSQEAVIRRALETAGVAPDEVGYLEAHGSGTPLGDPIEIRAVEAVLGAGRPPERPLVLGSVKANLGHLEGAAGVAGLVKAIVVLRRGECPPQAQLERVNPHLDLGGGALDIPTAPRPWPSGYAARIAGVSSFGLSGINSHVLLEAAPDADQPAAPAHVEGEQDQPTALLLSARDGRALEQLARAFRELLERAPETLRDVCFSAATRRAHHEHRLALVGSTPLQVLAALGARGDARAGVPRAARVSAPAPLALLCDEVLPPGGVLLLLHGEPAARARLEQCEGLLGELAGWSLAAELEQTRAGAPAPDPARAPAVLCALQVSLASLWDAWGLRPVAVVGHGMGEIAAACVAGALPLRDALRWAVEAGAGERPARDAHAQGAALALPLHATSGGQADLRPLHASGCRALLGLCGVTSATLPRALAAAGVEFDLWPPAGDGAPGTASAALVASAAAAYRAGHDLAWERILPRGRFVRLPSYPWQRERHWIEPRRHSPGPASDPLDGLTYALEWRDQPAPHAARDDGPGRWLLLADEGSVAAELQARLTAGGHDVELLPAEVDLEADPEVLRRRVQAFVARPDAAPARGVVFLRGLDAELDDAADAAALEIVERRTTVGALHLAQALARLDRPGPRVWLVTRGVHPPGGVPGAPERPALGSASLWGLGRSLALEQPESWGGLIDLGASDAGGAAALASELLLWRADGDDQVALHGGRRLVPRLGARPLARPEVPPGLRPDHSYLITGGLGAIGQELMRFLVARGARHLVVAGRRGRERVSPSVAAALAELESQGATIEIVALDVADEPAVAQLCARFGTELPPLAGIVHAAAVLDDEFLVPLAEMDAAALAAVLRPKSLGAWNLHRHSRGHALDFLVCFSSSASLLGASRFAPYAAGNHFLDVLAHRRRSLGLPATTVNWGVWDTGLDARGEGRRRDFERLGLLALPPAPAFDALERVLASGAAQTMVAAVDWTRLVPVLSAQRRRPLLEGLAAPPAARASDDDALRRRLLAADGERRLALLQDVVRRELATVLGFDPETWDDGDVGFADLGLDSIVLVELQRVLQARLGLSFPPTLLFNYPTVRALAQALGARLAEKAEDAARAEPAPRAVSAGPAARDAGIAIIGLGCRFPGGADDPGAYWRLLADGRDGVREVPAGRWDAAAFYAPEPARRGKTHAQRAGFLDHDVGAFDAGFFSISPREARQLDPQQRLLLEVAWEALEHAGLAPARLRDSRTGVFVGVTAMDYLHLLTADGRLAQADAYTATGNLLNFGSGRLSHFLGLRGPSLSLDSACSSSLVGVHLACQSLRDGEADLALAGGVNLMLSPMGAVLLSQNQVLSRDGRCKTFDASADGMGRGEGAGIVVLKRLDEALRDGDRVLAVIRGSAVNHDGASSGFTVPNGLAQRALLRACLERAGVEPREVRYVEAHGTGTPLGDPIELEALGAVLGDGRAPDDPFVVGSVKSNFGHLESAAGIAGLIKVVLALLHERIPPNLHFRTPNPAIPWAQIPARVPTTLLAWPAGRRVAGVSSFGMGGTNAHVLLEQAPSRPVAPAAETGPALVPLSAQGETALRELAGRLAAHLDAHPELALDQVAHTLTAGRAQLPQRLALVAGSTRELRAALAAVARGEAAPGVLFGRARRPAPRIGFLFDGEGAPLRDLSRALDRQPAWREVIDACDTWLVERRGRSLRALLDDDEARLERSEWARPALFAVQVALARVFGAHGIEPRWVLGHGVGELAAGHVAGALSLEDGFLLAVEHGRAPRDGAPVAPPTPAGTSTARLRPPGMPWILSRTGRVAGPADLDDPAPWSRPARAPARLDEALATLFAQGCDTCVEIGPGAGLLALAERAAGDGRERLMIPSSLGGREPLQGVGLLFVSGAPLASPRPAATPRLALPTYPFQRRRFWAAPAPAAPPDAVQRPRADVADWFYAVEWPVGSVPGEAAAAFDAPARLAAGAVARAGDVMRAHVGDSAAVVARLETLAGVFARRASTELGDGAQVLPAYRRLLARVREIAAEAGPRADEVDPAALAGRVSAEHPDWRVNLVLLERCGPRLADVMRGACDPLDLLFAAEAESSAADLYRDSPPLRAVHALVREVVAALVARTTGRLRVLEIGAGSGATSAEVLPLLPAERTAYTFSDISPVLVERARARLAAWPFVEYAVLDIDAAPDPARGLDAFDLVLASNVLHVSRDLRRALAHLRELLVPQGLLLFVEGTARQAQVDLTFGLTRDFWAFEDETLRRAHCLLGHDQWRDLLRASGFEDVASLPDDAAQRAALADQVLFLARRPAAPAWSVSGAAPWLVLADRAGLGARVAEQVRAQGGDARLAPAGEGERLRAWLSENAPPAGRLAGVIDLRALDAPPAARLDAPALADAQRTLCTGVLDLVQGLASRADAGPAGQGRLWLVTRGAQAVVAGDTLAGLAAAGAWGLGSAVGSEYPALWGGLLDLDPSASEASQAQAVLERVARLGAEERVARRGDSWHVARLARREPRAASAPLAPDGDATYLIAGGLGDIGLALGARLIERGARHLALIARGAPSPEAQARLDAWRERGARVEVRRADLADAGQLQAALAELRALLPPLRGVVHAAGALADELLARQSWETFAPVLAPKVQGAWNLHVATAGDELEFFVLFSSFAALLTAPGQANHAAANAFVDALAHHRRALGRPALALDWGGWAEIGALARRGGAQLRAHRGLAQMGTAEALDAFELALYEGGAQLAINPIDWPVLLRQLGRQRPALFTAFALPAAAESRPAGAAQPLPDLPAELARVTPDERHALLVRFVRRHAAAVLGAAAGAEIEAGRPLGELGLDSLMALELRRTLGAGIAQALPANLVYDHPTVEEIATYLATRLGFAGPAADEPQAVLRSRPAHAGPSPEAGAGDDAGVAVVGMGCRLPGGIAHPDDLYRFLLEGGDAIGRCPPERWDADALYDQDPDAPGKIVTRQGGFLSDIDLFDAAFFGISPREARFMDPQQRLLLEVVFEAFEHAGIAVADLAGSRTGVFVGISSFDYAQLWLGAGGPEDINAYFGSGNAGSIAAGRISYLFGFEGPAVAVDTACSSSLAALHLALASLERGECDLAVVAGVNLILTPAVSIGHSRAGMLAPDGRCKAFAEAADGFSRSEGCAAVVLERRADARRSGRRARALVLASAMNQDGRSSSLTAPNGRAQQAVVRQALERAGLRPQAVGYVEAHGTGTALGDPIEVRALGEVLGLGRGPDEVLRIGSIKTNLGHLEAAAGLTGFLKAALIVERGQIPPSLHFDRPSTRIEWERFALEVPTRVTPWPCERGPRVAGVSAFGFGGTNVHVLLQQPAPPADGDARDEPGAPLLLPLSARGGDALREVARRYAAAVKAAARSGPAAVADLCFTASVGRSQLLYRRALSAPNAEALVEALEAVAATEVAAPVKVARVAFLYTGQGAHYAASARPLYEAYPAFREALERCATLLAGLPGPYAQGPSLSDVLCREDGRELLGQAAWLQPGLFSFQVALTELWRSWGVRPQAVLGHSLGEYAAAWCAGVLDLEAGLRLSSLRGRLMQELPPGGAMASLVASEDEVAARIAAYPDVSIAAQNGPAETVISGARGAVEAIVAGFREGGGKAYPLAVTHAFHSPLLEPMLAPFEREAEKLSYAVPRLPLFSNVSGSAVPAERVLDAAYWRRHLRAPVRFADALRALASGEPCVCLEIGSDAVLTALARRGLKDAARAYLPSLARTRPAAEQLQRSLGELFELGVDLDWRGVWRGRERRTVDLPGYPWQRQRYWLDLPARRRPETGEASAHPLLGGRQELPPDALHFSTEIASQAPAYLADHRVRGAAVVPASAFLELLAAAARESLGAPEAELRDVELTESLTLPPGTALQMRTTVERDPGEQLLVRVFSRAGRERWRLHAGARAARASSSSSPARPSLDEALAARGQELPVAELFARLRARGLEFGPSFRGLTRVWRASGAALGQVLRPATAAHEAGYGLHPALLDACFQVMAAALLDADAAPGAAGDRAAVYLPVAAARVWLRPGAADELWCRAEVRAGGDGFHVCDLRVFDAAGGPLASIDGLRLQRAQAAGADVEGWFYELRWRALERGPTVVDPAQVAAEAGAQFESLAAGAGVRRYGELIRRIEELCPALAARALARLGAASLEPSEIEHRADELRVDARHRRLFRRVVELAGEARRPGDDDSEARLDALARDFPDATHEVHLLRRCGLNLAEVLRGEADPLELLFPQGSLDATRHLYGAAPPALVFGGLVRGAVERLRAALPARARVLEVGAGTGGTTRHVLPALCEGCEYVFTDLSPHFLGAARREFASAQGLRVELLDIERDPAGQGFEAEAFDLVIATNVLHATADLRRSLGHVRRLLRPGGVLLAVETVVVSRRADLTFGLTEGWWRFSDLDLRPRSALLPRADWLRLLAECGFEAAALEPRDLAPLDEQTLFVARAAGPVGARRHVVCVGRRALARGLAEELERRGDRHQQVDSSDEPEQAARSLRRALAQAPGGVPLEVVFLEGLDTPAHDGLTTAALLEAQRRIVGGALALLQALLREGAVARVSLVTRGAQAVDQGPHAVDLVAATLWGLARTAAREHPELGLGCLDLDPDDRAGDARALLSWLDGPARDGEAEVAFRGPTAWVPRLVPVPRQGAPAPDVHPYRLVSASPGVLDSLTFESFERRAPGPGEVELEVAASGLNFRDVLCALGAYPGRLGPLGNECAGTVVRVGDGVAEFQPGDEVVALAPGSFASHVTLRAEALAPRPRGLTAEEAATLPVAFMTADYALGALGQVRAGERVLIHAAAGGVGQAAVQLALEAGAEVFATASPGKWALLRALGVRHVFSSRTLDFAPQVLELTGGRGVDCVLNSLAGEFVDRSFACLAQGGRFIEIGRRGIWSPAEAAARRPDARYFPLVLDEQAEGDLPAMSRRFRELLARVGEASLSPLPRREFPIGAALHAFRHMEHAHHLGKLVLTHPRPGRGALRADASYLVTGGRGGLGLMVARWMVAQGAGCVVLLSRGAPPAEAVAELEASGARIVVVQADVSALAELRACFARFGRGLPPLAGVVHGAGALDDGALLQQNWSRFAAVFAAKLAGAWNLHLLTRARRLDFFALFSAGATLFGSRGQANHAAANAFLDALAHHRRALGLPAVSLAWGPWSRTGAAAEREFDKRVAEHGMGSIAPEAGVAAFAAALLRGGDAHLAVLPVDDWARLTAALGERAGALFAELSSQRRPAASADERRAAPARPGGVPRFEPGPISDEAARRRLSEHVFALAARVLGAPGLHPQLALQDQGLDSLLSIELRNLLAESLGRALPVTLLFDHPTLEKLVAHLERELWPEAEAARAEPAAIASGAPAAEPEDAPLSEQEALAYLLSLGDLDEDD